MTTGPTDVKVTTAAGGPGGMPLALKLNEGLGVCPELDLLERLRDMMAAVGEIERLRAAMTELVALQEPNHQSYAAYLDRSRAAWAAAALALGPNVRVEAGPTAKPQARTMENSASPLCGPGILMLGLASNEGLGLAGKRRQEEVIGSVRVE